MDPQGIMAIMAEDDFQNYPRKATRSTEHLSRVARAFNMCNFAGAAYLAAVLVRLSRGNNDESLLTTTLLSLVVFLAAAVPAVTLASGALHKSPGLAVGILVVLTIVPCGAILMLMYLQSELKKEAMRYGILPSFGFVFPWHVKAAKERLADRVERDGQADETTT